MSLGAFLGGVSEGVGRGVALGTAVNKKKLDDAVNETAKAFTEKLKERGFTTGLNDKGGNLGAATVPQDTPANSFNLGSVDYMNGGSKEANEQNPGRQANDVMTYAVQGYAEGGLVEEEPMQAPSQSLSMARNPNAMVNQVQENTPPTTVQQNGQKQKSRLEIAEDMSAAYFAGRDKALELGQGQLAMLYMQKGFEAQDQVYQHKKTQAQNIFDSTGDISGLIDVYNNQVPDDYDVQDYKQTPNGYQITFKSPNGQSQTKDYSPDEIRQLVVELDDPNTRWRLQMEALRNRQMKVQGYKDELSMHAAKKQIDIEANSIDPEKRYKTYANGYYDMSGGKPVWHENEEGKDTKNYNKEMLGVLKETNDLVLQYNGMSTMDEITGKVTPTELGVQAQRYASQVIKYNEDLLPAEAAEIAEIGVTDPRSNVFLNFEKDGKRYRTLAVRHNGKDYMLSGEYEQIDTPKSKTTIAKNGESDNVSKSGGSGSQSTPITQSDAKQSQQSAPTKKPTIADKQAQSLASAKPSRPVSAKEQKQIEETYGKMDLNDLRDAKQELLERKADWITTPAKIEYIDKLISAYEAANSANFPGKKS